MTAPTMRCVGLLVCALFLGVLRTGGRGADHAGRRGDGAVAPRTCRRTRRSGADYDPWEPFNRTMFDFNEDVDKYVLKPVATGWDFILPRPVQHSVDNFFDNLQIPGPLREQPAAGRDRPRRGRPVPLRRQHDRGHRRPVRLGDRHGLAEADGRLRADARPLGRTARVPTSSGRSSARRTPATPSGSSRIPTWTSRACSATSATLAAARVVQTVNTRSLLLDDVDAAREASLDFYIAVRTAYFERRRNLIQGTSETERGTDDNLYFPDYSDQEVTP